MIMMMWWMRLLDMQGLDHEEVANVKGGGRRNSETVEDWATSMING